MHVTTRIFARTPPVLARISAWLTPQRLRIYPLALLVATLASYGLTLSKSQRGLEPGGQLVGRDFLAFFVAGEMVSCGDAAGLYDPTQQRAAQCRLIDQLCATSRDTRPSARWNQVCLYLNPPHYALATSLLAPLGYWGALAAWSALSLLCLAATLAIWRRWLPADAWQTAVMLVVCSPPFFQALAGGQNTFISLLILTGFCHLLLKRRDWLAGLVLSLLLYKFQLVAVPVLYLLLTKRWRGLAGTTTGVLITLGITLYALGPDALRDYAAFSRRLPDLMNLPGFDVQKQHSWHGFWTLLLGYRGSSGLSIARSLTVVSSLATLILAAGSWRGRDDAGGRVPCQLSIMIFASMLISPHLFHYDMLLASTSAVLWFSSAATRWNSRRMAVMVIFFVLFAWLAVSPCIAAGAHLQLTPWLLLACIAIGKLPSPGADAICAK